MTAAQIAEAIFDQLGGYRMGDGYKVLCPCHADKNPSLHISVSDDRVLVHCHAGCDQGDIVATLKERQLWPNSTTPKPDRSARTLTGTYEYRDMDGAIIAIKKRWDFLENGKPAKACAWYGPDGSKGVPKGAKPLLYRAERLKDMPADQPIYVVEGEKCVRTLEALGQIAVCAPHGAKEKGEGHGWKPEYAPLLIGRRVRFLPDNDAPGRAHMAAAAASLKGAASEVKTVELPGLGAGEDIVDWLQKGQNDLGLLVSLFVQAPEHEQPSHITRISLEDLLAKEIPPLRWIVPGLIPEGTTILAGKSKLGKSWMVLGICLAVACGGKALGSLDVDRGPVLYLALEDNERRLQDRSRKLLVGRKATGTLDFWLECPPLDQGGLDHIAEWLDRHPGARFIAIDTLEPMRPEASKRNMYADDYRTIRPLHRLAMERNVGLLIVTHARKLEADDPIDEMHGTTGVPGGVDGILVLRRKRGSPDAVLSVTQRDAETEALTLKWDSVLTNWRVVAVGDDYQVTQEQREIMELLVESDDPMTPYELGELSGKSVAAIKVMLGRMMRAGAVQRAGRGRYSPVDLPTAEDVAKGAAEYLRQQTLEHDEDENDEGYIPF